jgi:hypothetical protein
MKNIDFCQQNGIGIYIPYGDNRPHDTLDAGFGVFEKFGIPAQYVKFPFPALSHGQSLDHILHNTSFSYYVFFENDSVPLKENIIQIIFDKIKDNRTIFGQAQQSNHKLVNGTYQHVYAGPGCLAFSRQLWLELGSPSLDHNERGDTAEELTWVAKEKGYNICLVYPSDVYEKNTDLDNGLKFGLGNTFGDLFYHSMQQNNPKSTELFLTICQNIINK